MKITLLMTFSTIIPFDTRNGIKATMLHYNRQQSSVKKKRFSSECESIRVYSLYFSCLSTMFGVSPKLFSKKGSYVDCMDRVSRKLSWMACTMNGFSLLHFDFSQKILRIMMVKAALVNAMESRKLATTSS